MNEELRQFHDAMMELVGLINQPQRDSVIIREAGVTIDRALFPLLARIARRAPLAVGELAGLVGRDYSTVSRQLAKMESLGLVNRQPSPVDKRISEVTLTPAGQDMATALDGARERLMEPFFATWQPDERRTLTMLLRRFSQAFGDRMTPEE